MSMSGYERHPPRRRTGPIGRPFPLTPTPQERSRPEQWERRRPTGTITTTRLSSKRSVERWNGSPYRWMPRVPEIVLSAPSSLRTGLVRLRHPRERPSGVPVARASDSGPAAVAVCLAMTGAPHLHRLPAMRAASIIKAAHLIGGHAGRALASGARPPDVVGSGRRVRSFIEPQHLRPYCDSL